MKIKPQHIFFCFHQKFDTGTWSIAFVFTITVMFTGMFFTTLSYSMPKCICPDVWTHMSVLPVAFKVVYCLMLFFQLSFIITSISVIYGTFRARCKTFPIYIIQMIVIELVVFVGSIFMIIQLANMDQYLLLSNDAYWEMAKMVLKPELIVELEKILTSASGIFGLMNLEMGDMLNLDSLMDATLKEGVVTVLGGMKLMFQITMVLLLLGINSLFISTILTVGCHYKKLKLGLASTPGPPSMLINKAILSNSVRSTVSDSLSDDWSGMSVRKLQRMRSRDYKHLPASTRSSSMGTKIYEVECLDLDVSEKFPRNHL